MYFKCSLYLPDYCNSIIRWIETFNPCHDLIIPRMAVLEVPRLWSKLKLETLFWSFTDWHGSVPWIRSSFTFVILKWIVIRSFVVPSGWIIFKMTFLNFHLASLSICPHRLSYFLCFGSIGFLPSGFLRWWWCLHCMWTREIPLCPGWLLSGW